MGTVAAALALVAADRDVAHDPFFNGHARYPFGAISVAAV